jgi:CheY-like chemotaxis protein
LLYLVGAQADAIQMRLFMSTVMEMKAQLSSSQRPRQISSRSGRRARILVAEDSPVLQRLTTLILTQLGCIVDIAGNGEIAVEQERKHRYDLILMDVHMPVMNGLQATRAIRNQQRQAGRSVPIVGVTAGQMKAECLAAGMDDYYLKPCPYQDLIERWLPVNTRVKLSEHLCGV